MRRILFICWLMSLIYIESCTQISHVQKKEGQQMPSIIPKPHKIEIHDEVFIFDKDVVMQIAGDSEELQQNGLYLNDWFERTTGFKLSIEVAANDQSNKRVVILDSGLNRADLGNEGYLLEVRSNSIILKANSSQGVFYAIQTLRQLLPFEYGVPSASAIKWEIPAVLIEDVPRYAWRGMMLDVSRHFFPKEFVKEFIDYLAMYKMNSFHWHLGDDQGWRVEIKKYPKLAEISAWRVDREDRHWNDRPAQEAGEEATYGGYYTQEDIKEIVEYAKSRYIKIVPEIEMPGHTVAVLTAYPQYSCTGGPFTVLPGGYWPISDIFCAGNDSTFLFLQDVLSEVMDLFPGKYIHIGGDEAEKSNWKKCLKCQARIKNEGLHDEHELQSYFIKRIESFINSKGRKLIGWDEILEGGLAPQAAVMSWRGFDGGITAARSGHDVVMSPTSHCYFDYYQGSQDSEPLAIGGFLPLSKVYQFEPTPDSLTIEEAKHVLGGQANLWTEYIPDLSHAQYMIFPRISALSEAVWTTKNIRDWNDFAVRIENEMNRFDYMNINYAKSSYQVSINGYYNQEKKQFQVEISAELPQLEIRYTTNGSEPNIKSQKYLDPFNVDKSAVIKAKAFKNGIRVSAQKELSLKIHKATGKKVVLENKYSKRFAGGGAVGLTNSMRGSTNYGDGRWQGYEVLDLTAVVDLGEEMDISYLSTGFLQDINTWIFLPKKVSYAVSIDGQTFKTVAEVINEPPDRQANKVVKEVSVKISEQKIRYIRVIAENLEVCPDWHVGAGGKAWLFVDEIVVE